VALIFHQNMRAFSGKSVTRNAVLTDALDDVATTTGSTYAAAGFTDVRSSGSALRGNLEALAQMLDPGLRELVLVEVGTTAGNRRELVGIAWNEGIVHVEHVGSVSYDAKAVRWSASATSAGAIPANRVVPLEAPSAGPDTRGLAFVAGLRVATKTRCLIGFVHGRFAIGTATRTFQNLGRMARAAADAVGHPEAEVILGGDFNLAPRPPTARGGVVLSPRGARVVFGGAYVATIDADAHDFWLVSDAAITDAQAAVYPDTRVANGSDHAAITLAR